MLRDVLVIGGGPAGATAALALARSGRSVVLVEKAEFPRRKVCGEFVSATTLPLLDDLGVGEAFRALAGPDVRRVGFFAGEAEAVAPMPRRPDAEPWGRALGRDRLDQLLLDAARAAGAEVRQPVTVTDLRAAGDRATAVIESRSDRDEIGAHTIIAAHGSWEPSAFLIDRLAGHRPSDLLAFKAHFRNTRLPLGLMPLIVFPGGYGGMVHTDRGLTSLSCCIRRDELQACRRRYPGASAGEAVLRHIDASCAGVAAALSGASIEGAWLSAGPIRPGIRRGYADGVFRVGNLAGEAHPIIAEGISMAIQSGWLLAQLLIAGNGPREAIGRRYEREWRAAFAPRLRVAALYATAATRTSAPSAILPVLKRLPGLLTFGAALSGKTRHLPH